MQSEYTLTQKDRDDILNTRLVPVVNPKEGEKHLYRAKVGGESQVITVQVKRVFRAPYGKGKTSLYADVFGYGISRVVQAKKLLKQEKVPSKGRSRLHDHTGK